MQSRIFFEDGQYKTITIVAIGGNHTVTFNNDNIEIQTSSGAYNTQRAVFTVFDGIEIPEEFTKIKMYGHITFGPISPSYGGLSYYIQDDVETGAYEYIQEHPTVYHMNDYHIGGNGSSSWSGNSISDEYDFVWENEIGDIESTFGGRYIGVLTNCLHQCASCNIKITKIVIEGE